MLKWWKDVLDQSPTTMVWIRGSLKKTVPSSGQFVLLVSLKIQTRQTDTTSYKTKTKITLRLGGWTEELFRIDDKVFITQHS